MKQIELINKRTRREKHFLREDGTILAQVYAEDVHYLKDGKYEEIDNTLVKEGDVFVNKSNDYKVEFKENFKDSLMKMEKDNHYIDFKIKELKESPLNSGKRKLSRQMNNVTYNDITEDIKVEYETLSNKVKETIVLQKKEHSTLRFELDTDLDLEEIDGEILAKDTLGNIIFRIEKPYMVDSNNVRNDNVHYLIDRFDDLYLLTLVLDDEWLNSDDRIFPVYVDPTISNHGQNINLYDTYIYPGDTGEDRNSKPYLKAGVERINGLDRVNRTLIKFDLPTIGTGSEVVGAYLDLIGYLSSSNKEGENRPLVEVHRVTTNWNEQDANWSMMHDKYDSRIEAFFESRRSTTLVNVLMPNICGADITSLVKKWYRNTPNYGLLLKSVEEVYINDDYPAFFSKYNTVQGDSPKPILSIIYRNQNGLESYLNYKSQDFTDGSTHVNTYNGNLTATFHLGHTIGGSFPVSVGLVYNTNDVILNHKTIFGLGYKLSLNQTITATTIGGIDYLEYLDEDGTLHYFKKEENQAVYQDEDGLELTIEKTDTTCIMTDKSNNKMTFTSKNNIYYLTSIKDREDNLIQIDLDSNNNITKVMDQNNLEITFTYLENKIVVTSLDSSVTLNYSNGDLISIDTIHGTTGISYNSNHLISSITDVTSLKIKYEYCSEKPYKMKKVTQYGLEEKEGQFFTLEYGFNTTSIIDNKNRCETLIFNESGNLLSSNSLHSSEDVDNAYSIVSEYAKDKPNKITSSSIPVQCIKNYLENTSFEQDRDYFINSTVLEKSMSLEECFVGNRSLKIRGNKEEYIEQNISVLKGKYYTFSGYFKNDNTITISLSYVDRTGNEVICSEVVEKSSSFVRSDVTIYYDINATSDLKIRITLNESCTSYIDAIQLEEGEVANSYNIIENCDFSKGISDWNLKACKDYQTEVDASKYFCLAKINNNQKSVLKVKMNPSLFYTRFSKKFPIKGKKGDLYTISFWYKNEGVPSSRAYAGNSVKIYFVLASGELPEYCVLSSPDFNPNENIWQYFSYRSTALEDFKEIELIFEQNTQANDFYITNLCFYKDVTSGDYKYDEKGNVVSIMNQSKEENVFKYDSKNQLIKSTSPKGTDFKYEYDNKKQNRVLSAIASSGIANEVKYDKYGNPITTKISKKYMEELVDGKYRIRSKGTNKYLKAELDMVLLEENPCSNTIWDIEKIEDKYKFIYSILKEYSMTHSNEVLGLSTQNKENLFILEKNENGSYSIRINLSEDKGAKYLMAKENTLEFIYKNEDTAPFEFYFELIDDLFMETDATYTEDGRFVESVTDTNFNKTMYETDTVNGLLLSQTNPNGLKTSYSYNDKKQLIKITTEDREVNYNYNNKNLLEKISQGNKEYKFFYDDFLNVCKVSIGDNILLTENIYEENNGNLLKSKYGNNQEITYSYDKFDRIDTLNKMDNSYHYKYDNNGNIAKILSNTYNEKYSYDVSKRINEYKNDNFKISYTYNLNNSVISKRYKLDTMIHTLENTLNKEEYITDMKLDNRNIHYSYDSLGRVVLRNISNYVTKYNYLRNGNRTTNLIESILNNNDKYEYKYDSLYNITDIYYNHNLIKHYEYDIYNELIKEENYDNNRIVEYSYDTSGNLLKITSKDRNNNLIEVNTYSYTNNNWEDQLTKYNDKNIIYDEIGNPIKIGEFATLSWINGRSLKRYKDIEKNIDIEYVYNGDGIRTSKKVNGKEIKYYLENNDIIYEQRENNTIYYLYDLTGVVGLEYNGDTYYYIKNIQDDVIGLLNSNNEKVVSYEYDSWGKVLSIKDSLGQEIIDENHIGIINPYRYRSYYYDTETKLYYLNSRYYNPEWKRFINADVVLGANKDMIGYNLYAYCSNNPIMNSDSTGHGLWNNIKKTVNKVVNTVKTTVKNVKNFVGSLLTVNKNKTTTTPKNKPTNIFASYESGTYTTTIKNITGGESSRHNSFEIGNEHGKDTTFGIQHKEENLSFMMEKSITGQKMTINSDNTSHSFEFGLQGINFYFRKSHGAFVKDDTIKGVYEQYNINAGLVVVTVIITAEAIPFIIKEAIDIIGKAVNSGGTLVTN